MPSICNKLASIYCWFFNHYYSDLIYKDSFNNFYMVKNKLVPIEAVLHAMACLSKEDNKSVELPLPIEQIPEGLSRVCLRCKKIQNSKTQQYKDASYEKVGYNSFRSKK